MSAVEVAKTADLKDTGGLLVRIGGVEIGLFRVGGAVKAWRNHCPHMGAPVCRGAVTGTMLTSAVYQYAPGRDGEILQCPWHGWEFDLTDGRHLAPGSPARLRGYPIRIVGDSVLVQFRALRR
jgi:nitrite reductase (NADH) small subunit